MVRTLIPLFLLLSSGDAVRAEPFISEFMAVNTANLADEDGDFPDWIEVCNPGAAGVNLAGWFLSDDPADLRKWRLPSRILPSGGYLLVFASGKDRREPGSELHANFRLDGAGEFLALVRPDGSAAHAFAPGFPPQLTDISYGITRPVVFSLLVATGAACRVHVPLDATDEESWNLPGFDDAAWPAAATGIGYDEGPDLDGLIGPGGDVRAVMQGVNGSVYLRIPFDVPSLAGFSALKLRMKYDDGFAAYLNGRPAADRAAPADPRYHSLATAARNIADAVVFEEFDLTARLEDLQPGANVLAIQGMNVSTSNRTLLVLPELEIGLADTNPANFTLSFFATPTPAAENIAGASRLGPIILPAGNPAPPAPGGDLVVTARVSATFFPLKEVKLYHRVMYGAESEAVLADDGTAPDAAAGDGLYTAAISTAGAQPGQMIRWRYTAEDTLTRVITRNPPFPDPNDSPEYHGTIVEDASVQSLLPVLHWFVVNPSAANSRGGTRGSMYYQGRFYDNVLTDLHGQSTAGFPKKSYDVDFNTGDRFEYADDAPRLKDFNLLTNWADKSKTRNTLAYETINKAGHPGHFAFPVRVQQNAQFFSVADLVEDGDDRYLDRAGLDPDGALYKMYNRLDSSTSGVSKKTRKHENHADLQAFIDGLGQSGDARVRYAYDHLDLPRAVNYYAALTMVNNRDYGHKNYYLYRDTEGTGEWTPLVWDIDLSFGRNWISGPAYFDDTFTNNPLKTGANNRLRETIFDTPEFYQMLTRRIRTLMDELLEPPGTINGKHEQRLAGLLAEIDPAGGASDADRDYAQWGTWGNGNTMQQAVDRILNEHLPTRRTHLFVTLHQANGGDIPDAQQASTAVNIGDIDFNPASGNQDEEYLELVNPNAFAVDLSGWTLAGAVDHVFISGTVLPAADAGNPLLGRLYVVRDTGGFRARAAGPSGNQKRFVQGNYQGQLSARGETVRLFDPATNQVASLAYPGAPTPAQEQLRITEIHFAPPPPTAAELAASNLLEAADFEFLELRNIGAAGLDLQGCTFIDGIGYAFPSTPLPAGEFGVLVRNPAAFELRYGTGWPVVGVYTGRLDNAGEKLWLQDPVGENVLQFDYDNAWIPSADGAGDSLTVRDAFAPFGDWELASHWRAGALLHGSPGWDDAELFDGDGDGVADAWEIEQLGHTNLQARADGDLDGLDLREEYVVGGDPEQSGDPAGLAVVHADGVERVRFETRAVSGAGYLHHSRRYTLQRCTDLVNEDWQPVSGYDGVEGLGQTVTYTNVIPAQTTYYRLLIELQGPY